MFHDLEDAVCGTGDSFDTAGPALHCDVVDMEGYAMAKVCRLEGMPFGCAKYISDGADHAAATDWRDSLPRAAEAFLALHRRLLGDR